MLIGCLTCAFDGSPTFQRQELQKIFRVIWDTERKENKKLGFYNSVKEKFEEEPIMRSSVGHQSCRRTVQFRTSSHQLNVETGRYQKNRNNPTSRLCRYCTVADTDSDTMLALSELPFYEPIIEDEHHVLRCCPNYHDLRSVLSDPVKEHLFRDPSVLFTEGFVEETSLYLKKVFRRRFPDSHPSRL